MSATPDNPRRDLTVSPAEIAANERYAAMRHPNNGLGHDAEACRQIIIAAITRSGADMIVSTAPPIVIAPPYEPVAFTCKHGTRYWVEPSGRQRGEWDRATREAQA